MIISHKYKFIFIKTQKTAGTSIEVYLSQFCGPNDTLTPIIPPVDGHEARNYTGIDKLFPRSEREKKAAQVTVGGQFPDTDAFFNHIAARRIQYVLPPLVWDQYYKFCIERNPWDKTLSHYDMLRQRSGGNMTFDEYLNRGVFCQNHPKYTDFDGKLIVDRVVYFENLKEGLTEVFERIGIPFSGSLGMRLKSGNRSDQSPYQEIYNHTQRRIIETAFDKEILLHSYRF